MSPTNCQKAPVTLSFGDTRVTLLYLGLFALDGGAMFGVVPKTIWNRLLPADEKNRVPLACNVVLIESGKEKILVDAGVGGKFEDKYRDIYVVKEPEDAIAQALGQVGLTPEDITQAHFTHLHFDHAGGATYKDASGDIRPTFPNATYRVHRGEWEYGTCPHERCKASYLKENLKPLEASGQLQLYDGDATEILPGVYMRVSGGHTPYHQILTIERPEGGAIFWGDLIPTRHHVKIPFVMGYDEHPMETMAVKREWLQRAADNRWLHLFDHEIDHPVCRLTPTGKPDDYAIEPVVDTDVALVRH